MWAMPSLCCCRGFWLALLGSKFIPIPDECRVGVFEHAMEGILVLGGTGQIARPQANGNLGRVSADN